MNIEISYKDDGLWLSVDGNVDIDIGVQGDESVTAFRTFLCKHTKGTALEMVLKHLAEDYQKQYPGGTP